MREKINIYRSFCREMGLSVNVEKCKDIVVGDTSRKGIKEIAGIKVKNGIKYLGIKVWNKRDIREHMKGNLRMARKMVGYVGYVTRV